MFDANFSNASRAILSRLLEAVMAGTSILSEPHRDVQDVVVSTKMVVRGQERRQGHDATRTRHAWLQHWRGSSALSYIFDSRKHRKKRGTITMDALRMLEKAAVSIKSGELGECRWRGENWDRGCWGWNINASACVFLVDDL